MSLSCQCFQSFELHLRREGVDFTLRRHDSTWLSAIDVETHLLILIEIDNPACAVIVPEFLCMKVS